MQHQPLPSACKPWTPWLPNTGQLLHFHDRPLTWCMYPIVLAANMRFATTCCWPRIPHRCCRHSSPSKRLLSCCRLVNYLPSSGLEHVHMSYIHSIAPSSSLSSCLTWPCVFRCQPDPPHASRLFNTIGCSSVVIVWRATHLCRVEYLCQMQVSSPAETDSGRCPLNPHHHAPSTTAVAAFGPHMITRRYRMSALQME